jgi:hypothetical protein
VRRLVRRIFLHTDSDALLSYPVKLVFPLDFVFHKSVEQVGDVQFGSVKTNVSLFEIHADYLCYEIEYLSFLCAGHDSFHIEAEFFRFNSLLRH